MMLAILAVEFRDVLFQSLAADVGVHVYNEVRMSVGMAVIVGLAIFTSSWALADKGVADSPRRSVRRFIEQRIGYMRRKGNNGEREYIAVPSPSRNPVEDAIESEGGADTMPSIRFLCHDLRSPQNSILALTELARTDAALFEECGGLDQIARLANYTLALSENFIFSSLTEDARRREFTQIDPVCLAVRVFEQMTPVARERGVRLSCHTSLHEKLTVKGIPEFLSRAIQNLLDNAIQASPEGAGVTLEIIALANVIEIAVQDEAGGVPGVKDGEAAVDLSYILREKAVRRFGLGLEIASRIASMQGGSLRAVSMAGKGARFVLSLPASCIQDSTSDAGNAAAGRG